MNTSPAPANLPHFLFIPPVEASGQIIPDYSSVVNLFTSLVGSYVALDNSDSLNTRIREIQQKYAAEQVFARAETAVTDFRLPPDVFTRDATDLLRKESLSDLIQERQIYRAPSRFNADRCRKVFINDPEFDILMEIASSGVRIDTDESFACCSNPDATRQIETRLPNTLAFHAFELWRTGAVLLLPRTILNPYKPHYSNVHWVPKPGLDIGRFLGDCSNREVGSPLNSRLAKDLIKDRFGTIEHPTIAELVNMIVQFADLHGGLSNVVLWKEDIAGAFGQYNHRASDCHLLSFPIAPDLAMVYMCGMFGWTGSPYAFGPFSRAFKRQCNLRIHGRMDVYVDDFMGVSTVANGDRDQELAQQLIVDAFGPGGINLAKSTPPVRWTELIGWTVDLDLGTLRPNPKGIEKLALAFFSINIDEKQSLHSLQVLASLACRYSQGLRGMRSFVQPLYVLTRGWHRKLHRKSLTSSSKLAIVMWRSVTLILLSDPTFLAVPLSTFRTTSVEDWQFFIISDAGPEALGVAVYDRSYHCLAHTSFKLPFHATESRYQNAREFQGLLLGELVLCWLGINHARIEWRGDNMSELSWARRDMCTSSTAQVSFLAHSWLNILSDNEIVSVVHQAGTTMGDIDGLSRFRVTQFEAITDVTAHLRTASELFVLCDPTANRSTISSHYDCLCRILHVLKHFLSQCSFH